MLLLESIRDEDERWLITVITEIASRFSEYEVVDCKGMFNDRSD